MIHGTLTAYHADGCRCEICRRFVVRHQKKWRLDRARGIERMVDADHIRAHVAQLLEQGMSFRGIALTAGYTSRNALSSALSKKKVQRKTHDRIMGITVASDARRFGYVDSTGSCRRIQALGAIGWPTRAIAARMGVKDHATVVDLSSGRNRTIRRSTAVKVRAVYEELWNQPGPSAVSARRAAAKGWLPPAAWDDDGIDDPKHVAEDVRRRGRSTITMQDIEEARAQGYMTAMEIGWRLGYSQDAIAQFLSRASRGAA
jgi:lambda repressor-like predicted transcriptional regulator